MSITQCPICNTYKSDSKSPCPTCHYAESITQESLLKIVSERLRSGHHEINQVVQTVKMIGRLEINAFTELEVDKLYTIIFSYTNLFNCFPQELSPEQLSLIEKIPQFLKRDPFPVLSETEEEEEIGTENSSEEAVLQKEPIKKRKRKKVRLIGPGKLNLILKEDPDYDGYYETILPPDYERIQNRKRRFNKREFGLTGLVTILTVIAATAFSIPFIF